MTGRSRRCNDDAERPPAQARRRPCLDQVAIEHDPEKAFPGLDPGWKPVFRKDHASPKKLERQSIQSEAITLSSYV